MGIIIRDNGQHGLSKGFRLVLGPSRARAGSIDAPLTINGETTLAPCDNACFPKATVSRRAMIQSILTGDYLKAMSANTKTREGRRFMRTLAFKVAKALHYRKHGNTDRANAAGRLARRRMSALLAREAADLRQVERYAHDNRIGARRDTTDPRGKLFTMSQTEFRNSNLPNCFTMSLPAFVANSKPVVVPVSPYIVDDRGRVYDTRPGMVDAWQIV